MSHFDELLAEVEHCIEHCSHDVSSPVEHMLMICRAMLLLTEAIVEGTHELTAAIRESGPPGPSV